MRIINILLVEDDPVDVMDIERNLNKLKILYKLIKARNGEEAIELLESMDGSSSKPYPDLLLIDINMPRMNGLELLAIIRSRAEWKELKCFIISTSEQFEDMNAAKEYGISGYIVKPFKLNNASSIDAFNLTIDLMNFKM